MMRRIASISVGIIALTAGIAHAEGKWRIGGGVQFERSASDSGNVRSYQLNLGNIRRATISAEYRPNDLFGFGADIGLPAKLPIKSERGNTVIDLDTSTITLMGRYYPKFPNKLRPFVGFGAIYSRYTDERLYGSFSRYDLKIGNDLAPIIATGIEVSHSQRGIIRAELGYNRAEADISFGPENPVEVGAIKLNPVKVNVSYLLNF